VYSYVSAHPELMGLVEESHRVQICSAGEQKSWVHLYTLVSQKKLYGRQLSDCSRSAVC